MNILILSDIVAGGEWIATQTLVEKLREKDKNLKFYLVAFSKNKYLLDKSLFKKTILIRKKSYKRPLKYYRELFYELSEGAKIIGKTCQENIFDHVITIDYILSVSYLISQKKSDYIYYFHGVKNGYIIFQDAFNHFMVFKKLLEILALIVSKKIIIPSIQAKTYLTNNYGFFLRRTSFPIVPNFIRSQFYVKSPIKVKNKEKILLYSGRLDPNKGIRNLVYAFLKLTKEYPQLTLAIAYFGKPDTKLFNEIKDYIDRGKKIMLYNNLKTTALANLYRSSSLGILPSVFEISPLFYKEALACNLPIFTTDIGDVERDSNLFLLKDAKTDTISDKITDFLKNENKYIKCAKTIFKKWQYDYDENKIISNFLKAIKK